MIVVDGDVICPSCGSSLREDKKKDAMIAMLRKELSKANGALESEDDDQIKFINLQSKKIKKLQKEVEKLKEQAKWLNQE
tara:strand:- start:8921 stop:9160 length:240 start_codon:yes stop_codon:yes gene_type:complete